MSNKIDDFVGRTFGQQEQVIVLPWDGERRNGAKYYKVRCAVCADDSELYGEAVFGSFKASLLKGQLPCGCGGGIRFTQKQLEVFLSRECNKVGTIFKGLFGEWKGTFTKFTQECPVCGHQWSTGSKNNIIAGCGCPKCVHLSLMKNDEVMVASFMASGAFIEGTKFQRSGRGRWEYQCPVCSNDEYVNAGLCSGIFTAATHSLQSGRRSCRCSVKYNWTKEQRELQVAKIIDSENLTVSFVGWVNGYSGCSSKMTLVCEDHGTWHADASSFIRSGSRCPDCAESGYRKAKPGNLYVMTSGDITKVGITNRKVKLRLLDINRRLPSSISQPFEVLYHNNFIDGSIPRRIEDETKQMLKILYRPVTDKFDGYTECFFDVDRTHLLNFISKEINNITQ